MGALAKIGVTAGLAVLGYGAAKGAGEEVGEQLGGKLVPLLVGAAALFLIVQMARR